MSLDWSLHPLAFMELFVVLSLGLGWWVLQRYAARLDARRRRDEAGADQQPPPPE